MRAVIAGAGIGRLSAAPALHRRGITGHVLERDHLARKHFPAHRVRPGPRELGRPTSLSHSQTRTPEVRRVIWHTLPHLDPSAV